MTPSQFPIIDDNIKNFRSFNIEKYTKADCFINSLQLLDLIDVDTSTLLRFTANASEQGFPWEIMEQIFMYLFYRKDINKFFNLIVLNLSLIHI